MIWGDMWFFLFFSFFFLPRNNARRFLHYACGDVSTGLDGETGTYVEFSVMGISNCLFRVNEVLFMINF